VGGVRSGSGGGGRKRGPDAAADETTAVAGSNGVSKRKRVKQTQINWANMLPPVSPDVIMGPGSSSVNTAKREGVVATGRTGDRGMRESAGLGGEGGPGGSQLAAAAAAVQGAAGEARGRRAAGCSQEADKPAAAAAAEAEAGTARKSAALAGGGGGGGIRVGPGATACGGGGKAWHGSKHSGWVLIGSGLEEGEKAQLKQLAAVAGKEGGLWAVLRCEESVCSKYEFVYVWRGWGIGRV
jgi:hypothetical protein